MFSVEDRRAQRVESNGDIFFLISEKRTPIYVMGRNEYTEYALSGFDELGIPVSGIIDDFTTISYYKGLPVRRSRDLEKDSIVITCVLDGKLVTSISTLNNAGVYNVLSYLDLVLWNEGVFMPVGFCENNSSDILNNRDKYAWLYSILTDKQSKDTLQYITDFRLNYDPSVMRNFQFRIHEQYFDVFNVRNEETFVDCGAFDGETSRIFSDLCPNYEKIYVFEPSPKNYINTCERLQGLPRITIFPYATFHQATVLTFNDGKGPASTLSSLGNVEVNAVRLDDVIEDRVTFLKLDVEGAELSTILGAERLIKTCRPRLAVCVYHNQKDFWEIPEILLNYHNDYKVKLRHYTEGIFETIMYFE